MGSKLRKIIVWMVLPVISVSASLRAQPDIPENLPKPPPLPPEILNRKPPSPPPDLPAPSELIEQLKQLEELLSMSPEKLQKLRETIEIIENKSSAEREAMRIRIRQVTQMTDDLRREIISFQSLLPEFSRSDLTQFWLAMEDQERESLRNKLTPLSPEKKKALLRAEVSQFIIRRDQVFKDMRKAVSQPKD